ncbi:CsgE family curli-type amyloid fiber assembly protein [Aureivirga sp. CE67]|uniref:CsgE family curli-type amyloid fiber assembly protein n=1 Tax=Aureivirga sp. CE67 TaxID=1788983 RepID=UPI0018CB579C|nr:CsgE family curli-type amyloid fiber assembly protein [Aureivirga sp. CE67]
MNKKIVFIIFLISHLFYSQEEKKLKSEIDYNIKGKSVEIFTILENQSNFYIEDVSVQMLILKKVASKKYEKQNVSERISIPAHNKMKVLQTYLNFEAKDEIKVFFFGRVESKLIAKDSLTIRLNPNQNNLEPIKETEIEIKGIVVEEVRTKLGKDFYDVFYGQMMSKNLKYPFMIYVYEKPSFGRGSVVEVKIEDRIIYRFQTKPDVEFINQQAKNAIRRLERESKNRKNWKKIRGI